MLLGRTRALWTQMGRVSGQATEGGSLTSPVGGTLPGLSSERPLAALAGEAGEDVAAVVVQVLDELVAGVGEDTRRSDLIGLAGVEVTFDRDVACAEGVGRDRGDELEPEQRPSGGST